MDAKIYALKTVPIYLGVQEDICMHSGYKEIQAISRLCHNNIVRYFSSWVEPVVPNKERLDKIARHLKKSSNNHQQDKFDKDNFESIDEEEGSSEEFNHDLRQNELDEGPLLIESQEDSDDFDHSKSSVSGSKNGDDDESCYDTEIDSETTMYKFMQKKQDFIMADFNILMEYADGKSLREVMEQ